MKWATKASLSLLALSSLLLGTSASAGEFGISGGYFVPWSGTDDAGWLINAQLLTSDPGSQWRWGGEFEYRDYETEIIGVSNVKTQDILVSGVLHWRPWPDKITPYLGLGAGAGLTIVDRNKVQDNSQLFRNYFVNKVGFMLGALALAGVEFPLGTHFAFYTELRGNIWARLENGDDNTYRDTSGWGARGGIKLLF